MHPSGNPPAHLGEDGNEAYSLDDFSNGHGAITAEAILEALQSVLCTVIVMPTEDASVISGINGALGLSSPNKEPTKASKMLTAKGKAFSLLDVGSFCWQADGTEGVVCTLRKMLLTLVFLPVAAITGLRPVFSDHAEAAVKEIYLLSLVISLSVLGRILTLRGIRSKFKKKQLALTDQSASAQADQDEQEKEELDLAQNSWDVAVVAVLLLEMLLIPFMGRGIMWSFRAPAAKPATDAEMSVPSSHGNLSLGWPTTSGAFAPQETLLVDTHIPPVVPA